jgi:hypothetical protein
MAKPTLTRSAALHLRIGAFAGLLATLLVGFQPITAVAIAIAVSWLLAKL